MYRIVLERALGAPGSSVAREESQHKVLHPTLTHHASSPSLSPSDPFWVAGAKQQRLFHFVLEVQNGSRRVWGGAALLGVLRCSVKVGAMTPLYLHYWD